MSDPPQLGQLDRETITDTTKTLAQDGTQTEVSLKDGDRQRTVLSEARVSVRSSDSEEPASSLNGDGLPKSPEQSLEQSSEQSPEESPEESPEQSDERGEAIEAKPRIDEPVDEPVDNPPELNSSTDPMESSVATLKPSKASFLTINPPPYVDPTPPTPFASQPPSRTASTRRPEGSGPEPSPTRSEIGYDERRFASDDENDGNSRSEIDTIMAQFPEGGGGPGEDEVMSPRLEIASPLLASPSLQHPPRKSSLEPLTPSIAQQLHSLNLASPSATSIASKDMHDIEDQGPPVPPKDGADGGLTPESSSVQGAPPHRPPPPEPEPEPALPFDFHRFLEQLKHKKADPVARYLKSFLSEFAKRQWMVHEQVKIISDFLAFIANKMAQCEVWSEVSDAEFDNAREGMEKLVMNRLYTQTFSPAIPAPQPIPGAKPRRRGGERPMGPGRRGQHQEDVERDEVLAQKISIYGWVREEHLDIPPVGDSGRRFLLLAQQGEQPASGPRTKWALN